MPLMVKGAKQKTGTGKKELLLFLSIPVTLIVLVAAVLLIPNTFAKPKYDFIYTTCEQYACDYSYHVTSQDKLERQNLDTNIMYTQQFPQLYYHDTSSNSSRLIDEADAEQLQLDGSNVSPDGYRLEQPNNDSGVLFWGGSSDFHWYLVNGLKKKQMNVVTVNGYDRDISFVGWVLQ
jgi:hypothetical protein